MNHSESIKAVSLAFCNAQREFKAAIKDSNNPFFKSKYANIEAVLEAIAKPFSDQRLSVLQPLHSKDGHWYIQTIILHESGEWIESEPMQLILEDLKNPQKFGASVTYFRRFSLTSMLGISQEDDDGTSISPNPGGQALDVVKGVVHNYAPHADFAFPEAERVGGEYVFTFGKFKGQSISSVAQKDLLSYGHYIIDQAKKSGKSISVGALEAIAAIEKETGFSFQK